MFCPCLKFFALHNTILTTLCQSPRHGPGKFAIGPWFSSLLTGRAGTVWRGFFLFPFTISVWFEFQTKNTNSPVDDCLRLA